MHLDILPAGFYRPVSLMTNHPDQTAPVSRETSERDLGVQPLDGLMTRLEIDNHALVASSTEHLTHKMVARGRKGRRLTLNIQDKICNAVNAVLKGKELEPVAAKDLFNYRHPARERAAKSQA
ncbi:MAG: hypothetical protein KDN22_02475 [Verrucomicrobiae bacterium]|nr:hypothetical protein [Verrucomicrobiae bacterium]